MKFPTYVIRLWDVDQDIFIIKGQELELEEMDIYFSTGLSRQGEAVQLFRSRRGESTRSPVHRYCPGAEITNEGKVKIVTITGNLVLRTILSTMARVSSTQGLHEASKSQF